MLQNFSSKKLDDKLIGEVLKLGFSSRVGNSKRSLAVNVLWLGEGGETYRKLSFEAQFPKISKSFIWKTNFATFAKPLLALVCNCLQTLCV
jgi:hypothetical protein